MNCDKVLLSTGAVLNISDKTISCLPMDASDLANFLTIDQHIGFSNCSAHALLRSLLMEKHEICFSVVSLLWHKMIRAPETQMSQEGISAQQGWRQVVDALRIVVLASPTKASIAIIRQADGDLQPWIARDDKHSQIMWKINQRVVKLIAEIMKSHESPEALVIVASASDLLLHATDGMLVDGEACTLPQLELLEATARAVKLVLDWGASGVMVADGLSNLLKCRLPLTIRCLSHPSAHVRALSTLVLRCVLHSNSTMSFDNNRMDVNGSCDPSLRCLRIGFIDWRADIDKYLKWETHSQHAAGMTHAFLDTAARELGFDISY